MELKLILFDFSGTLAFPLCPEPEEFYPALEDFGVKVKTEKERKNFSDIFSDLLGWAKGWLDFSQKILEKFFQKPVKAQIVGLAEFLKKNFTFHLYDDTKEVFNIPVQKAILSGNARFLMEDLGLQRFAEIFTPRETKFLKPDKRAFLFPLKKMEVKPREAAMVGDDIERDLIPAKELGMEAILIDRENKAKDPPVKKINSLKKLWEVLGFSNKLSAK